MFNVEDKIFIRPHGPVYEAYEVWLRYPAWDELHEMIPRQYFYGGVFYDGRGNIVDIIEERDIVIKHPDGSWELIKRKEFLKSYEVLQEEWDGSGA